MIRYEVAQASRMNVKLMHSENMCLHCARRFFLHTRTTRSRAIRAEVYAAISGMRCYLLKTISNGAGADLCAVFLHARCCIYSHPPGADRHVQFRFPENMPRELE